MNSVTHLDLLYRPPTWSACYSNSQKKGRKKTKAYRDWIELADWTSRLNGNAYIAGPVEVTHYIKFPGFVRHTLPDGTVIKKARFDAGNLLKPLDDYLTRCGIIQDDGMIVHERALFVPPADLALDVEVHIEIAPTKWPGQ